MYASVYSAQAFKFLWQPGCEIQKSLMWCVNFALFDLLQKKKKTPLMVSIATITYPDCVIFFTVLKIKPCNYMSFWSTSFRGAGDWNICVLKNYDFIENFARELM